MEGEKDQNNQLKSPFDRGHTPMLELSLSFLGLKQIFDIVSDLLVEVL
jgi:hypothetical protein